MRKRFIKLSEKVLRKSKEPERKEARDTSVKRQRTEEEPEQIDSRQHPDAAGLEENAAVVSLACPHPEQQGEKA